jgi:hypothetical protein
MKPQSVCSKFTSQHIPAPKTVGVPKEMLKKMSYDWLTNYMEQSPSESESHPSGQDIYFMPFMKPAD